MFLSAPLIKLDSSSPFPLFLSLSPSQRPHVFALDIGAAAGTSLTELGLYVFLKLRTKKTIDVLVSSVD